MGHNEAWTPLPIRVNDTYQIFLIGLVCNAET